MNPADKTLLYYMEMQSRGCELYHGGHRLTCIEFDEDGNHRRRHFEPPSHVRQREDVQ